MLYTAQYDGDLKCTVTREDGKSVSTATGAEYGGDASALSPTDLVAAGLVTCILTTIGAWGTKYGFDFSGVTATVEKAMSDAPPRRIAKLAVTITLPNSLPKEMRPRVERVSHSCPVHASLHPDMEAPINFRYE